ncbi:MAG: lipoyl synthase [Candidatus Omnitrophica bacterium]|nr:lipoyl synthase [Candidatus Omnitrophota bacterium]MBU1127473.1 lipoyl synthase [Candidatus Omnitrophota bacterium]MBU1785053.1 lipoyl synthase [Candidatus Omnitrophota bacterium]
MRASNTTASKRPVWMKKRISWDARSGEVRSILDDLELNSVCVSAACPNRPECWKEKQVTFMILGENCTRSCKFCNVHKDPPEKVDILEPGRVAKAVKKLEIRYAVITSVTRDDLPDLGSDQFIRTVRSIKEKVPVVPVELLIPDMGADERLLKEIAVSGADVIGHNIETPRELFKTVRPGAGYGRSLKVLETLRKYCATIPIKSSMIVGLGETKPGISSTMKDLRNAGVDIIYLGQYLSPTREHWPVAKYYTPEEFQLLKDEAVKLGFSVVCSAPMVRSSYRAENAWRMTQNAKRRTQNAERE